jgi:hypothetical protein
VLATDSSAQLLDQASIVSLDLGPLLVVGRRVDGRTRAWVAKTFGIDATVQHVFRLTGDEDQAYDLLWATLGRMLRDAPHDTILLNTTLEVPILRRTQGVDIANELQPWTQSDLQALGPTWKIGADPGPNNM